VAAGQCPIVEVSSPVEVRSGEPITFTAVVRGGDQCVAPTFIWSKSDGIMTTVDAGYREKPFTEVWIVPSGALPPQASPTVDPSEVRPPKPKSAKKAAKKRK